MTDATQTNARKVPITLSGGEPRHCDIVIEPGSIRRLGESCRRLFAVSDEIKILLLTDSNLAETYLADAQASLEAAGFSVSPCVIPAGEPSKCLTQAQRVYETALQANLSRKDVFLGLGGGVVGDLAGFCASTWHRGARLIHVPTTLVAQVDSAIGGKTAVNFGHVKNMVGAFYQPMAVLSDPTVLDTLPPRELSAGLAEVVKYGLIETSCTGETGFFDWLLDNAQNLKPGFPTMIERCSAIKASVVMQDETETKGLRHFLNLGHTFGHAYESLSQYGILHGEAVAIGLIKAVQLSNRLGLADVSLLEALRRLLQAVGLGESLQQAGRFHPTALLDCMRQDKKNLGNHIRLILPCGAPGKVIVRTDAPDEMILSVLSGI